MVFLTRARVGSSARNRCVPSVDSTLISGEIFCYPIRPPPPQTHTTLHPRSPALSRALEAMFEGGRAIVERKEGEREGGRERRRQTALLATKAGRASAKAERERESSRPSSLFLFRVWALVETASSNLLPSLLPPFLKSVMPLLERNRSDHHSAFAVSEKRKKMRWVHRGNRKSPPTPQPRARASSPFRFGIGGLLREGAAVTVS